MATARLSDTGDTRPAMIADAARQEAAIAASDDTPRPRTRITQDASGWVTLCYYDEAEGRTRTRTFTAPWGRPGYVREHRRDGSTTQPCDGLYSTGATLYATRDTLLAVIRREWRARARAEARANR